MVAEFTALRPIARIFIGLIVLAGASVIGHSIYQLTSEPIGNRWIILAVLTLLTGSFNVKVPSINAYISVSEAFVFASILLFGTPAGTATVVIECMVVVFWMKPESRLVHRVLFNMAAPSVSVWTAGTAFYLLSGIQPYSKAFTPLPELFFPLLVFTALYFLLNSWLVAIAVGLENHRSPVQIWWKNFAWLSVNYFSGASLAALIVTYTQQLDFSALAVIIPLLVVSYLTFRTAMGRAEDSYNHLAELNRLYLSTIETLAMAIDAKDQITHGHIRRVQTYAVGLAKNLGVTEEKLLKAIEAAALLHDMGKLAVPEHILNKPGKLTPAEFEKMKLHASVGADILSAIDFPYPVVPIVRHHHENWNGTGYPDGIKGTDIPIGARILSVVDCFDALTSDRPYRPKLSDDEALAILMERRSSMYDPLVVDTFVRVYAQITPEHLSLPPTLQKIAKATSDTETRQANTGKPLSGASIDRLSALEASLSGYRTNAEIADIVARHLRRLVPFSLSILYMYDSRHDELVAEYVVGEAGHLVSDLRISRGERLSGWVAANRQSILNSDPALDLGVISTLTTPPLRTSISVPLVAENELLAVLTLYSATERFSEAQKQIVETAAQFAAESLSNLRESIVVRA
jgi:putative nucleotidyltransferase with HDIG domain